MRINPKSSAPDGSDSVWLGQRGQIPTWSHTLMFPGGPSDASFTFNGSQDDKPYLQGGRRIDAVAGSVPIFTGRLEVPKPGQPWQCDVTGIAAMAKDYTVGSGYTTLNQLVDDCIAAGLPWVRSASVASPGKTPDPFDTLDDVLGSLVAEGNHLWIVKPDGHFSTIDGPDTEPSWILRLRDLPAKTMDNYSNVVRYKYLSGVSVTTYNIAEVPAGKLAREGRYESTLDMTSLGILTGPAADAIAAKVLALRSQIRWTDKFVIGAYGLYNMGGTLSDAISIQPGQMIQIAAMRPLDPLAERFTVIAGQIDYSSDGTAAVTPYYSKIDDLITATSELK